MTASVDSEISSEFFGLLNQAKIPTVSLILILLCRSRDHIPDNSAECWTQDHIGEYKLRYNSISHISDRNFRFVLVCQVMG